VSGNSGGGIFIGNGNNDARCLFRRPKPNRPEPDFWLGRGFGVCSKETWPWELPSDRDDSDALGTGRDSEETPSAWDSCADSVSVSGRWLVDRRPGSSTSAFWLFMKANGRLAMSKLVFLSTDFRERRVGRSVE
jgi:hypothetical protein